MITNVIMQYYGMMHVMARVSTPDASLGSGVSGCWSPQDPGDPGI